MLSSEIAPDFYHLATKHSYRSVQIDPNYVDSSTQPSPFKRYPKFFRRFPLNLNHPTQAFLHFSSAITFQKMYREGAYALRVNPSAGALFPTELYVQLRGINGLLDGIYHLEVETNSLTLIYELIDDGLEGYLSDQNLIKGCILLVTCVYFRSSWKYKNRSLRYCFLDAGHHLGAIAAAAAVYDRDLEILFDGDYVALNDELGFSNQEFVTAMIITGEKKEKLIRRLRSPLPIVSGTDYFEPNLFVEAGYRQTLTPASQRPFTATAPLHPDPDRWLHAIQHRRSARRLLPIAISKTAFLAIQATLQSVIPTRSDEIVSIYTVIQAVTELESGVYLPDRCLQLGEFREKVGYLCINQAIARDAAVVFFIASNYQNYRIALQLAGFLGQQIYLAATDLELGCSGIGAFFDDETQTFLQTESCILYAIAIGHDPAFHSAPIQTHHVSTLPPA